MPLLLNQVLAFLSLVLLTSGYSIPALPASTDAIEYRLPKTVTPSYYNLEVTVLPEDNVYDAMVSIDVTSTEHTNEIKLHASPDYITIREVLIDYEEFCLFSTPDNVTEIFTLTCDKNLTANERHTIVIAFTGLISDNDKYGFYKSKVEENGNVTDLIATQFSMSFARRAFPCFDEPAFKASFDIFISHSTDYIVLSNTPKDYIYNMGYKLLMTHFNTTPLMSTYMVGFMISNLEESTLIDVQEKNYDFKVYTRPSQTDFTTVAMQYGNKLINIMGEWTNITYENLGINQSCHVAIPEFEAGATENWGLTLYRELDLLDEGELTSYSTKSRILTNMAHEISLHWFGNLVTMTWWSSAWLKEGLATYFEYYAANLLDGENLELDKQFVVNVHQSVLKNDELPSAYPLSNDESEINSAIESLSKFDSITYNKGGSFVRMLRNVLGEESFKKGLQLYLNNYKHQNADPSDLINSLSETAGSSIDLSLYTENWITKPGFPLLTVNLNDNGKSVSVTQERFLSVTDDSLAEATQWYVPLSYTTSDEKDFSVTVKEWLKPDQNADISIKDGSWIILNIQESGFYRVNYDDTLWDRIITALNDETERESINVLNRAELVDDIFNIARVGKISYEKAFKLSDYLKSETEYYPWYSLFQSVKFMQGKLVDNTTEELLSERIINLIDQAFPNGIDPSTHVDHLKEVLLLEWSCKLGKQDCLSYATEEFEQYKTSLTLSDHNKREIVFCYGLKSTSTVENYNFLYNIFENSISANEQNDILSALGCIDDSELLEKYLMETISTDSPIKKQDSLTVFTSVYSQSSAGVDVALTFLEEHLSEIVDSYEGMNSIAKLITGLASVLSTDEQRTKLTNVIEENTDISEIQIISSEALNIMKANKLWADTYGSEIKTVLQEEDSNNSAFIVRYNLLFTVVAVVLATLFNF